MMKEFEFTKTLELIEEWLPKDDKGNFIEDQEKSDVVHDVLAFLAEQMIEMNKEKQRIRKEFKEWLESYIGTEINNLKPKTKLQKFDEFDWSVVLQVLLDNRNRLAVNPMLTNIQNKINSRYHDTMKKLKPLKIKIQKTDELIDQIVYKLYGLTDDEIKIVEESVGGR